MKIKNAKILVTGGAGFIGSHIVESLVKAGAQVTVYDNFSAGVKENLKDVINDVKIIKGDILDEEKLNKSFKGQDIISHQAAQLEIFRSTDDPIYDLKTNTIGTLNVLKAAKKQGIKKIINASSACVYGQVLGLTPENFNFRPNWAYGVSKLAAEKYCNIYNDYEGVPTINLRYSITYGEREWFRRVLTIFIKRAILGQSLVVFGDGDQIRDFIYVGDAARFHNLCIENDVVNGESYNVSTAIGTTISDLAKVVIAASGKNLKIIYENTKEGEFSKLVPDKKRNIAELKIMLLDNKKAFEDLKWQPQVDLLEGIKREYEWVKNNLNRWNKISYSK